MKNEPDEGGEDGEEEGTGEIKILSKKEKEKLKKEREKVSPAIFYPDSRSSCSRQRKKHKLLPRGLAEMLLLLKSLL